jgi:O-antigen/teichoic acid export membrane protein
MSRTRRFLGGVSFGYANQVLMTLTGLWLTPFLLHRLGPPDYGLWLVGTQVMAYLMLADCGVVALLPRQAAFAIGRAGGVTAATELPQLVGQTARLTLWQMPVAALAAVILWHSTTAEWPALRRPLGIVMLTFVALFPLRIFQAALQGVQDLAFLGATHLCAWAAGTAVTVGLVWRGAGLEALAAGWATTQLSLVALHGWRLRRRFPQAWPNGLPALRWAAARAQLTQGGWASLTQIAVVLVNGTDLFIIGASLGPAAVVPYACTGKLVSVLSNQPQMLMQAAGPALSEMRMGESRQRLFRACTALTQAMLMLSGAVACVVLAVNQGFVSWWVGAQQYSGLRLTALLVLSMLLRHWNTTAVYSIFCFGHERRLALTTLADGLVTAGAAAILVRLFGPVGAPLGSIVGVCLVSLPGNLTTLARESGVSAVGLLKPLWPISQRLLLLAAVAGISASLWVPKTLLGIGGAALVVALIYAAVMTPTALRSALGEYVRPQLTAVRMKFFGAVLANDVDA